MAWMLGTWDVVAVVPSDTAAKPDARRQQCLPILGGSWHGKSATIIPPACRTSASSAIARRRRQWTSIGLDSAGNAVVTTGAGWEENALTLSGDATIVGIRTTLRQILTRVRAMTLTP